MLGFFMGEKNPFPIRLSGSCFSLARSLAQMTARLEDLEKQIALKK